MFCAVTPNAKKAGNPPKSLSSIYTSPGGPVLELHGARRRRFCSETDLTEEKQVGCFYDGLTASDLPPLP